MDDDKTFTVYVKEAAYEFSALASEDLELIGALSALTVSPTKYVKAVSGALAKAAGPGQWDSITDQLTSGEITLNDMTAGILADLIEAMKEPESAPAPKAVARATSKRASKPRAARNAG